MLLKSAALGIGSLPFRGENAAEKAVELILSNFTEIPFWPQLPRLRPEEGMVAQYSENLPCLKFKDGNVVYDPTGRDARLESFYSEIISENRDYFKISSSYAAGFYCFLEKLETIDLSKIIYLKGHITGPFTFAASVKDEFGQALLFDPVMMQAITKGLAMKALWQKKVLKKFGKDIVIFIDEPYLGCFGSAYTPINKDDVLRVLGDLGEELKKDNILVGVHCCGNTDWSLLTENRTIDLISFDAFSFLDKFALYAEDLKRFLKRGGMICWGIVPTQEFTDECSAAVLVKKLQSGIDLLIKKGIPEDLVKKNLLISPSCGLGSLEPEKAAKIFQTLSQISALLKASF